MEEENVGTESTVPETQVAQQESTTPETTTETKPEVKAETKPEVKAEPAKIDIPKKFMKSDGTPDYDKMAKSYVNLEKAKQFVPAQSADDYTWDAPEDAVQLDPERVAEFKEQALAQGMTAKQYQFVMSSHDAVIKAMMQEFGAVSDRAVESLKAEWGNDFKSNVRAAHRGFEAFAPSSASRDDPVWDHPEVMKLLARIGGEVGEDSVSNKGGSRAQSGMTEDEKNAIMQSAAYIDGDQEAHAKVQAWYKSKYK